MGTAQRAPGPRRGRRRVHDRGQDRRHRGVPDVCRRQAGDRRDTRQRPGGRGHHRQSSHHRRYPARVARQRLAGADGNPRRGLLPARGIPQAQHPARRSRRTRIRQSAQRGGRRAATARPGHHAEPAPALLCLPDRADRGQHRRDHAHRHAGPAGGVGLSGRTASHMVPRSRGSQGAHRRARSAAPVAALRRRRRRGESRPAGAAGPTGHHQRPRPALGDRAQVRARGRHHPLARHRHQRRAYRRARAVRDAGAGRACGRDDQHGDPAQRRRGRPEGRPRRRLG